MVGLLDSLLASQTRYMYHESTLHKNVVKMDRNKLYRGHRGQVSLTNTNDLGSVICITNTWWNINVTQKMFIETNKTKVTVSCYAPVVPKYMTDFFVSLKKQYPIITNIKFSKNEDYTLEAILDNPMHSNTPFNLYFIEFNKELDQRILFTASETLDLAKSFNERYRHLKQVIKQNKDNSDFIKDAFEVEDNILYISYHLF